ncbi:class I SAM-dependent DNA methyltransferase [Cereibacter azotoformans]|uniref:site-specific DNA-methyltransferase (adenine-specific) n=1 Tax=Cereibacter azotoformans TaxID=43057 RepID=A0A2T5JMA4_9RHOB|nr:DNA methyltransferase [Cereibacter azotoformans]MBO4168850.1 class I SAM-dependent DNA methyltransferase [Cereibacter azotoformans]PTR08160.1 type II restriction/modification system DNA methylase subunit YeeA [Cereibacter azotoformans]
MNAVEIEEAISNLAEQQFDPDEFPYAFLLAFGNKDTTIKRLRTGASNKSDVGGVLQTNNIHIVVCAAGEVTKTLASLKASPATTKAKAKFVLATDGIDLEAEDLATGETVACAYRNFPDHFGFFLPLAGISTVKQIRESSFDIKATGRLNRLYVELLKDNPEWGTADRRHDMNHFMARLIFCFFAEDTDIFTKTGLFTATIEQMSGRDSGNTHEVIGEIFRAMNTKTQDRVAAGVARWANVFPYVNGGLFSGSTDVPLFSKIARSYLLHIGSLDWQKINPDIFGSMIQAVADDEERGALGMHYTSVPNILKVLNPLFLDDLRVKLEEAGNNPRKLLNLRNRMARIRVFDPACGSGNFLVIAYKEMRAIEAEINKRRDEADRRTDIPLTNFRGIELRDFPAEIARLALIIAEYQCDVLYRGQREALQDFLPLDAMNWITCGNALRIDWLSICPPTGTGVTMHGDDLFNTPLDQAEIDFENEGGETYICGNPPFKGTRKQKPHEKEDLERVFGGLTSKWKNVDYVGAWLMKAALYNDVCHAPFSFVATNSLCQGQQVPITWDLLLKRGFRIRFAHTSFTWSNLAANKAGVTVVVTGVDRETSGARWIYTGENRREVANINPYLTEHNISVVPAARKPIFSKVAMDYGVYYSKSAGLILESIEKDTLRQEGLPLRFVRRFLGSTEFINGKERFCLWIGDRELEEVSEYAGVRRRIESVRQDRLETDDKAVNKLAAKPHQFRERKGDESTKIFVPIVSSENRDYFPAGLADATVIPTNKAFFISNGPLWALSVISSKLHLSWIDTICGRLRTDYSYSNTLGWNTFPLPSLTEKNKEDLTRCAEDILLARETHFPATIADLYDPEKMPADLRAAHDRNDETLERIYIGRRFRNDTERLEKLFEMYTKMTKKGAA